MKRQRNIFQMKEQDKASEKDLSDAEISDLPDKEFKVMAIMMLTELGDEQMNTERTSTKRKYKKEPELKTTITAMKNTLDGITAD